MLFYLYLLPVIFTVAISGDKKAEEEDYLLDRKKEVKIEILELPAKCPKKSQKGDICSTDYSGYFPDGREFDSTYKRNQSMTYTMGDGSVIKGAEIGTMNMCKGEKRRITIPPHLAYGDEQYGQIPPGSTLMFDIVMTELLDDPFKQFDLSLFQNAVASN